MTRLTVTLSEDGRRLAIAHDLHEGVLVLDGFDQLVFRDEQTGIELLRGPGFFSAPKTEHPR